MTMITRACVCVCVGTCVRVCVLVCGAWLSWCVWTCGSACVRVAWTNRQDANRTPDKPVFFDLGESQCKEFQLHKNQIKWKLNHIQCLIELNKRKNRRNEQKKNVQRIRFQKELKTEFCLSIKVCRINPKSPGHQG